MTSVSSRCLPTIGTDGETDKSDRSKRVCCDFFCFSVISVLPCQITRFGRALCGRLTQYNKPSRTNPRQHYQHIWHIAPLLNASREKLRKKHCFLPPGNR